MKTMAVLDKFNIHSAPSHFVPLLLHMDPQSVVFFCDTRYTELFPGECAKLRDRGIRVEVDSYEGAKSHDYLLFDDSSAQVCLMEQKGQMPAAEWGKLWHRERYTKKDAKSVIYSHSVDDGPSDCNIPPGSFALHPYEWSFLKDTGDGVFMTDENGRVVASRSPNNVERVIAGFTHLAGYKKPETPAEKEALKEGLARKLGTEFDPDLPLIVFHYSPMDADEAEEGIERLAQSANVVIKYFPNHAYLGHFDRTPTIQGPRICYTADHALNPVLRLAADVNLASFISSVFVSSVAHGHRTIPVCTHKMSSASPYGTFPYPFYFQFMHKAYARMALNIGPVNIAFTEKLLRRLRDEEYWQEYESKLPELNHYIFGNYKTGDEAARIGAAHIMNLLRCGSFVTPEIRAKGRATKGQANLFNTPRPHICL